VVGATGGVGNQAVQLATKAGAHVVATAATDDERALVTDLGTAAVVDYSGDLAAEVRQAHPDGVDVVLHFAGDPSLAAASVRPGGHLASTLIMSPEQVPADDVTVHAIYANPDPATLERAARHHAAGDSRVRVQQTYPLDQIPAAFEAFIAGTLGKLVVNVV
jgi:NADPH:quinone reductase